MYVYSSPFHLSSAQSLGSWTPFPLQYFVAPRNKNHDESFECLHYDDVFCHMFGTEIMSRHFTFENDI